MHTMQWFNYIMQCDTGEAVDAVKYLAVQPACHPSDCLQDRALLQLPEA